MNFSVTERQSFRRCRRKAVLSSKNGQHLGPMFPPLNLSVGTIVHKAHQLWLERPSISMSDHALDASAWAIGQISINYTKQVGCPPSDTEMLVTHEAVDMALKMCENYAIKWGTPLPPEYKLLSAEQKIRVPVSGTEHPCPKCGGVGEYSYMHANVACFECIGSGSQVHYLEGRLDGLIQHSSGRIDVLEHKTYGSRPRTNDLQTNDQFLAYLWLVKQLGFNPSLDSCIAYDGMWRRDRVPRGRTFDDLFTRYTLTRTPAELEEFEHFLPLELNDMAALYAAPETAYINRPWQGCWDCSFFDGKNGEPGLCTAMSRNETGLVEHLTKTKFVTRTDDTEEELPETDE